MVLVFAGGNRDYGLMGISYWNVFTRRPVCAHLWLAICLAEITLFYSDNSAQEIASNSRLRRADLHCVGNCWRGWIVGRLWHACPCRSWFIIGAGWLAFLVGALAIAKSHTALEPV